MLRTGLYRVKHYLINDDRGFQMTKSERARASSADAGTTETVRDRILNTARELFYRDGARAVGVDTVVAQSGVAKTSSTAGFRPRTR